MVRPAIGFALAALFIAAVVWFALAQSSARCEVCVDYRGRSACSRAAAASAGEALAQAQSGACAQVAGGVTQTLECTGMRASVSRCD